MKENGGQNFYAVYVADIHECEDLLTIKQESSLPVVSVFCLKRKNVPVYY